MRRLIVSGNIGLTLADLVKQGGRVRRCNATARMPDGSTVTVRPAHHARNGTWDDVKYEYLTRPHPTD